MVPEGVDGLDKMLLVAAWCGSVSLLDTDTLLGMGGCSITAVVAMVGLVEVVADGLPVSPANGGEVVHALLDLEVLWSTITPDFNVGDVLRYVLLQNLLPHRNHKVHIILRLLNTHIVPIDSLDLVQFSWVESEDAGDEVLVESGLRYELSEVVVDDGGVSPLVCN